MKRHIVSFSIALVAVLSCSTAVAYTPLCSSAPSACEWTGPTAPTLDADVCYSRAAGVKLKSGSCPSGTTAYHVDYGEVVNPTNGEVAAYIPLPDACATPGLCSEGDPSGTEGQAICCEFGWCVDLGDVACNGPDDIAYYCDDGVSNIDGSVECFDGEPL